ncbi:MAG: type II secretion system protein N [Burkholderiaceae bacterium]
MGGKWLLRITTLAVWALAALSVTWWSLKFAGPGSTALNVPTVAALAPGSDPSDLARVFGPSIVNAPTAVADAPAVAPDPGVRMALMGVVANRAKTGVALISVDGKPARPYRVGSQIEDSYRLKSVATRSAVIEPWSPPGPEFTLELLPLAMAGMNDARPASPATPALLRAPPSPLPGVTSTPGVVPAPAPLPVPDYGRQLRPAR